MLIRNLTVQTPKADGRRRGISAPQGEEGVKIPSCSTAMMAGSHHHHTKRKWGVMSHGFYPLYHPLDTLI